ncbi:MAG TPA: DUF6600 domain-containing protein, partial [Holophagaceae bacterium]|nr:DUF6600 domain-containing protein [Holophagaceae bacterium]
MNPRTRLALLLALPALVMPALHAQDPGQEGDQQQYQGENPDRYAMVRALDGDVRITKGDVQDTLQKGTPVGEGDVVESSGRGVLQLGDGTRIAFDRNTRFTVASLFKDQSGSRQVLLRLDRGRLRLKQDGDSDASLRIDTPSGSISSSDRATYDVEVDADSVARISVTSGHVRVSNQRDDTSLGAGEQISVFGPQDPLNRIRAFNTYDGDDFDRWSDGAWTVRHGESWDRVPSELRYYSDDLDSHGTWVNTPEYGWVWQPRGVADDWRPYYDGRWAAYPGGMTWISYDPWSYVTYHHGRWAWSVGGWCWIPGVYYSPAWVAWNYQSGYCGWAPLGYYNTPCTWGYGAWGGGYCWNVVSINYINVRYVNRYCAYDRRIIGGFNRGNGGIVPPWRTRPLMATPAEFRNPAGGFQRVFQPAVNRERFANYQHNAETFMGRQVFFRANTGGNTGIVPPDRRGNGNGGIVPPGRVAFEDRGPLDRVEGGRPGNTGIVPPNRRDNSNPGNGNGGRIPGHDFQPRPNDRGEGAQNRPGNTGIVPPDRRVPQQNGPRDTPRPDRGWPDRRPDNVPDRSFQRDDERPAPRPMPQAPRREA